MSETTQVSSGLNIEMAGLDVIPESERKGTPSSLFMPWFAANISVLGISWGSWVLGFGLSLTQAILVSVVGVALSFLLCGLIAIAGKRGSAPTLVLSRAAFGYNGNRISAAISWILTVGWETFLAIMAVQATATVMGALGFSNHLLAQIIALVVVVVLAAGAGILGFEAIMKVQTWITWATAILTIVHPAASASKIEKLTMANPVPQNSTIFRHICIQQFLGINRCNMRKLSEFSVGGEHCADGQRQDFSVQLKPSNPRKELRIHVRMSNGIRINLRNDDRIPT